jgi:hypothetical protein
MAALYFGDVVSILTTALISGMLALIGILLVNGQRTRYWGRFILVFVLAGTAISALSATRDAFMMDGALFALTSVQSLVCAAAGCLIYLAGLAALFVKNQKFRKIDFYVISALFLVQVVTVEASRIAMM